MRLSRIIQILVNFDIPASMQHSYLLSLIMQKQPCSSCCVTLGIQNLGAPLHYVLIPAAPDVTFWPTYLLRFVKEVVHDDAEINRKSALQYLELGT